MEKHIPKVLVVEDEKSLLKAWIERFGRLGFKVLAAPDGVSAGEIALKDHPDLVVVDLVMPSSDGLMLVKKLREDKWGNGVPVMFLNSWQDPEVLAQEAGSANFHFAYNWSLEQVVEKVKHRLSGIPLGATAR